MINLVARIAVWMLLFFRTKPGSLERARLAVPAIMYSAMFMIILPAIAIASIENDLLRTLAYVLLWLGVFGGFVGIIIWGLYLLHRRDEFDRQLRARDAQLLKRKGSDAQ